jgi:transposase-like protein
MTETTGPVEIYGASVSKETISRITDKVIEEMNERMVRQTQSCRCSRKLDCATESSGR